MSILSRVTRVILLVLFGFVLSSPGDRIDSLIKQLQFRNPDALVMAEMKRCEAATILLYEDNPRAIPALVAALTDDSNRVRIQAAKCLRALKWEATNDLEKALYLGAWGDWKGCVKLGAPAVMPLILAVNNNAVGAAAGLGELKDERAIPALVAALDRNTNGLLQAAEAALLAIGTPAALAALDQAKKQRVIIFGIDRRWSVVVRNMTVAWIASLLAVLYLVIDTRLKKPDDSYEDISRGRKLLFAVFLPALLSFLLFLFGPFYFSGIPAVSSDPFWGRACQWAVAAACGIASFFVTGLLDLLLLPRQFGLCRTAFIIGLLVLPFASITVLFIALLI